VLKLAATADVFIQNFRPGVAERMGLGEAAVRAVAPAIVYVSISGFGERGPYAAKPAYDPVVQALSSLATIQAGSDKERPRLVRTILPDKLTAITAAQAITAALLARARTGQGQHVRLSMLDAMLQFLWSSDMAGQTFVGDEKPQQETASAIDLIYATADGHVSVAVQTNKQWEGLTRALEHAEWLDDPRFGTPALRQQHIDDRLRLTQEVLLTRPSAVWLERLTAADVPCAPVLTRSEVIHDPQVLASETLVETEHAAAGRLRQARPAARFSGTPAAVRFGAPRLGEHSAEVLAELGYAPGAIAALLGEAA
jgi:crotonobetainyl-CoA:carnitine CoA-transferase CaiB-like acyl-CoA transferase